MKIEPTKPIELRKYETRRVTPVFGDVLLQIHKKAMMRKVQAFNL